MIKVILMVDKFVGLEITKYIIENYRSDILFVVVTEYNKIAELCEKENVPWLKYYDDSQILNFSTEHKVIPDIGILGWWPKIIKTPLLNFPKFGFINTHPSLLPYNRGKHPNYWAIVEQVPYGVSIHFVDEGIDTGDIINQREIPYDWEDTGESLYKKATIEMIKLFKETYPLLRSMQFKVKRQQLEKGSFHYSRDIEDHSKIYLDRYYKARDLLNMLRARTFEGYPACWFEENGEIYEVRINIKRRKQKNEER